MNSILFTVAAFLLVHSTGCTDQNFFYFHRANHPSILSAADDHASIAHLNILSSDPSFQRLQAQATNYQPFEIQHPGVPGTAATPATAEATQPERNMLPTIFSANHIPPTNYYYNTYAGGPLGFHQQRLNTFDNVAQPPPLNTLQNPLPLVFQPTIPKHVVNVPPVPLPLEQLLHRSTISDAQGFFEVRQPAVTGYAYSIGSNDKIVATSSFILGSDKHDPSFSRFKFLGQRPFENSHNPYSSHFLHQKAVQNPSNAIVETPTPANEVIIAQTEQTTTDIIESTPTSNELNEPEKQTTVHAPDLADSTSTPTTDEVKESETSTPEMVREVVNSSTTPNEVVQPEKSIDNVESTPNEVTEPKNQEVLDENASNSFNVEGLDVIKELIAHVNETTQPEVQDKLLSNAVEEAVPNDSLQNGEAQKEEKPLEKIRLDVSSEKITRAENEPIEMLGEKALEILQAAVGSIDEKHMSETELGRTEEALQEVFMKAMEDMILAGMKKNISADPNEKKLEPVPESGSELMLSVPVNSEDTHIPQVGGESSNDISNPPEGNTPILKGVTEAIESVSEQAIPEKWAILTVVPGQGIGPNSGRIRGIPSVVESNTGVPVGGIVKGVIVTEPFPYSDGINPTNTSPSDETEAEATTEKLVAVDEAVSGQTAELQADGKPKAEPIQSNVELSNQLSELAHTEPKATEPKEEIKITGLPEGLQEDQHQASQGTLNTESPGSILEEQNGYDVEERSYNVKSPNSFQEQLFQETYKTSEMPPVHYNTASAQPLHENDTIATTIPTTETVTTEFVPVSTAPTQLPKASRPTSNGNVHSRYGTVESRYLHKPDFAALKLLHIERIKKVQQSRNSSKQIVRPDEKSQRQPVEAPVAENTEPTKRPRVRVVIKTKTRNQSLKSQAQQLKLT